MSFPKLLIAIVLICAGIAIVLLALPAMGVVVPPVFMSMFWVVLVAAFACVCILFLARWWSSIP